MLLLFLAVLYSPFEDLNMIAKENNNIHGMLLKGLNRTTKNNNNIHGV
jgi:hypothetical protein